MVNNLDQIIGGLIEVEASQEYEDSRKTIRERGEARETVREEVGKGTKIPNTGSNYAGLKRKKGNPKYKQVVETMAQKYKIPVSVVEEMIEESRGDQYSLVYGSREELNQKKFDFDDFEHFTPQV